MEEVFDKSDFNVFTPVRVNSDRGDFQFQLSDELLIVAMECE